MVHQLCQALWRHTYGARLLLLCQALWRHAYGARLLLPRPDRSASWSNAIRLCGLQHISGALKMSRARVSFTMNVYLVYIQNYYSRSQSFAVLAAEGSFPRNIENCVITATKFPSVSHILPLENVLPLLPASVVCSCRNQLP